MDAKQFGDLGLWLTLADIFDDKVVGIVQIPGDLADQIPELGAVFYVQIPSILLLIITHLHIRVNYFLC